MKRNKRLLWCGCLLLLAALVAVYGGNFSWRQVLIGGIALLICQFADEQFKGAVFAPPFVRFQFRFQLDYLGRAIKEAGIYEDDEFKEAMPAIFAGMAGHGSIVVTWLERELFYVNTTNHYSSTMETIIDLPSYGTRGQNGILDLPDILEMRMAAEGYELVLLTREQRYASRRTRDKGIVLFKMPYKALWAFQGDSFEVHKNVTEILATSGLVYHSDAEVSSAWDYQNEYGSFRWWDV